MPKSHLPHSEEDDVEMCNIEANEPAECRNKKAVGPILSSSENSILIVYRKNIY